MVGAGRTVRDGKAVEFELLRIETKDGKPVYLAMPQARAATEFRAIEQGESKIVFQRDGNDFPQRVIYWRDGDALMARIEGKDGKSQEWRFLRDRPLSAH